MGPDADAGDAGLATGSETDQNRSRQCCSRAMKPPSAAARAATGRCWARRPGCRRSFDEGLERARSAAWGNSSTSIAETRLVSSAEREPARQRSWGSRSRPDGRKLEQLALGVAAGHEHRRVVHRRHGDRCGVRRERERAPAPPAVVAFPWRPQCRNPRAPRDSGEPGLPTRRLPSPLEACFGRIVRHPESHVVRTVVCVAPASIGFPTASITRFAKTSLTFSLCTTAVAVRGVSILRSGRLRCPAGNCHSDRDRPGVEMSSSLLHLSPTCRQARSARAAS